MRYQKDSLKDFYFLKKYKNIWLKLNIFPIVTFLSIKLKYPTEPSIKTNWMCFIFSWAEPSRRAL